MSILIKGATMPTSCAECYFLVERFTGNEYVNECDLCGEQVDEECEMHTRWETCPLVEVPTPHGRLIDADALPHYTGYALSANEVAKAVELAPTIIEAEEGEEK